MVYQEASLLLRRAFTLLVILLALVIVVKSIPIVHDHLADGPSAPSVGLAGQQLSWAKSLLLRGRAPLADAARPERGPHFNPCIS